MKLCKDCKHSIQDEKPTWWQCDLTQTTSPVDGSVSYTLCSIARVTPSQCGVEGKWFAPDPDLVDQKPPDQYNREQA